MKEGDDNLTKLHRHKVETYYRKLAEEIAYEYWGVELTCPIIFVNRKWKRRNACFRYYIDPNEGGCEIILNHQVRERLGDDKYLRILKHELVHWYLWSTKQPHDDGDEVFVRECLRLGASISETKKAKKAYDEVRKVGTDDEG